MESKRRALPHNRKYLRLHAHIPELREEDHDMKFSTYTKFLPKTKDSATNKTTRFQMTSNPPGEHHHVTSKAGMWN